MTTYSRRQFLETSALAAAYGLAAREAFAQTPAPVTGTFTALRGNAGIFTGRGGTIGWLLAPDGVVVVDSQFPDTAQQCLDGVKAKATRPIDLLSTRIITAITPAATPCSSRTSATIVAHKNVPGLQKKAAANPPAGQPAPPPRPSPTRPMRRRGSRPSGRRGCA